jgi:hypothetical protein
MQAYGTLIDPMDSVVSLAEYFDSEKPVSSYVTELSDTEAHPAPSEAVKRLILGLVQRYAYEDIRSVQPNYSQLPNDTEMREFLPRTCLYDLQSTAALIQELIFTAMPLNEDGSCEFADLGTGTGILALGSTIAAIRAKASHVTGHCIDRVATMLGNTQRFLEQAAPGVSFVVQEADLTKPEIYRSLPVDKIRAWTSETINASVGTLLITADGATWTGEALGEPYPEILNLLLKHVPDCYDHVKTGRTLLFPDPINDRYRPHSHKQTLQLLTSNSHASHNRLNKVGADFSAYEVSMESRRWGQHVWRD